MCWNIINGSWICWAFIRIGWSNRPMNFSVQSAATTFCWTPAYLASLEVPHLFMCIGRDSNWFSIHCLSLAVMCRQSVCFSRLEWKWKKLSVYIWSFSKLLTMKVIQLEPFEIFSWKCYKEDSISENWALEALILDFFFFRIAQDSWAKNDAFLQRLWSFKDYSMKNCQFSLKRRNFYI